MRYVRFLVAAALVAAFTQPALAQPPVAFDDAGIHAVKFVDANEGWACGDDGVVWHTINGGRSWERQKTGTRASLRALHFVSEYVGWCVGRVDHPNGTSVGVMLKTTDGGVQWTEVGTNVMPGLSAVVFFDANTGLVCGDGTDAFPTGMFVTADGGGKWEPVKGPRLPSTRAAAMVPRPAGVAPRIADAVVGGAWGKLGPLTTNWGSFMRSGSDYLTGGTYADGELDPLAGRAVNGVACNATKEKPLCFAACDGGAVLVSSDGGKSWGYANLGLPEAVLACLDFRCVATAGDHVWVAGRPGGFVLHSGDSGKTWELQKTPLSVPANGIHFLDANTGWLVGEFGNIQGTTDGGKTWTAQRTGGQRAAALFLHANGKSTPLDVMALLGAADGYLCAATSIACADHATADPKRASDGLRLRNTVRAAGGAGAESGWAFPVSAHAVGMAPQELLAVWDRAHGGKAKEHMLRQAVLAIRMWQPEVIVCDVAAVDANPADALALLAVKEAFKQAADATCFPEQLNTLGLKVCSAKKLYALGTDPKAAPVKLDLNLFNTKLNDTPKDYAEGATRVLAGDAAVVGSRCFVLVSHRLQGAETQTNLMDGVTLAPGGPSRRVVGASYTDAAAVAEKQKAVQLRRNVEALAAFNDAELGGAEKALGMLRTELKKMPDDVAARTAYTVGTRFAREGKWTEAREVFGMLSIQYPGHPLAVEAFRWLARFHGSTEARRRVEIQQKMLLTSVSFEAPTEAKVKPASGTSARVGAPVVTEDHYKFHSPDMILKWHTAALELEPKLASFGPVYARDPAAWLCFLAARRHVGKYAEADKFVMDYFAQTAGAAELAPGIDVWRDCLATELWLANRNAMPTLPKPLGVCKLTDTRPLLDGKLDDDCWKAAKPLDLKSADKGDATGYKTEGLLTYDDKYLYIGVRCAHPAGKKAEPVAKRTRDADLSGHDRVDILLDLDRDYQTYYRFQIDHRGALAEDCWGDRTWNPKYHVAFHSDDTGWTAEMAIPLAELTGDRPAHGKAWAANLVRVVPGVGVQSWSGPADGDPRPEGMGLLQFRADK
jgi:photosystem II stability/assembly factor-like uncharacterized protein